ncbi:hypothetical protein [Agaribacterium sp. ZY112]|uniref:hypothetical protein n=1 Tax=Agaribacterium sp. ZY112 TaxID=3233574 RepID=UPI00352631AD
MFKKISSILFVLFVGYGLSACSSGGSDSNASAQGADTNTDNVNTDSGSNDPFQLSEAVDSSELTLPSKLEVVTNEN